MFWINKNFILFILICFFSFSCDNTGETEISGGDVRYFLSNSENFQVDQVEEDLVTHLNELGLEIDTMKIKPFDVIFSSYYFLVNEELVLEFKRGIGDDIILISYYSNEKKTGKSVVE